MARALAAARRAVPKGTFHRICLPARLPEGDHDLIVLSEILYFLDRDGIESLARQIESRWPAAEMVCVTWLGPSGNPLEGGEALDAFLAAMRRGFRTHLRRRDYRIDISAP